MWRKVETKWRRFLQIVGTTLKNFINNDKRYFTEMNSKDWHATLMISLELSVFIFRNHVGLFKRGLNYTTRQPPLQRRMRSLWSTRCGIGSEEWEKCCPLSRDLRISHNGNSSILVLDRNVLYKEKEYLSSTATIPSLVWHCLVVQGIPIYYLCVLML